MKLLTGPLAAFIVLGISAAWQADAAPTTSKRDACKASVAAQGLRGQEKRGAWMICMAEGRLDCTKQAVAQKLPREEMKPFIKTCMGAKAESKKDDKRGDKRDDKQDDQSD